MKKNTIKAFTLVEMLIVIVIIGILIASLMPRMQTAQGRARDVARKNDLSQIQTAIITSQADRGAWPGMKNNGDENDGAKNGIPVTAIKDQLIGAGMSEVPKDPNGSNDIYGLGTTVTNGNKGQYLYLVAKRNGVPKAGFVLMAKTEVEGSSNWVVCQNPTAPDSNGQALSHNQGVIGYGDDLSEITLCSKVSKDTDSANAHCSTADPTNCIYDETAELRYILLY